MNSHELNGKGRDHVKAELQRQGVGSVTSTSRGTRRTYLLATNPDHTRTIELRIKTRRKGDWHTTTLEAKPSTSPLDPKDIRAFWIFVDLGGSPRYWVVPDWWIRNDIHKAHERYLQKHGGHRAQNDDSDHHSIAEKRWKSGIANGRFSGFLLKNNNRANGR